MKSISRFSMVLILLLSCCSSTVIRTYDHYKHLPCDKQGFENNLIVSTPTKIEIDSRLKIAVINSGSDLIDTLLIKSSFRNIQFKNKPKTYQSFLVYSISQKVSGTLELNDQECLIILKDSKWYLNQSIQSK